MSHKPHRVTTASFLTATATLLSLSTQGAQADGPTVLEAAEDYTQISGYQPVNTDGLAETIVNGFSWDGSPPITPLRTISPSVMAILAVEALEEPLQRGRYRVEYGQGQVGGHQSGRMTDISFIQVDRFNLGPAIREDLIDIYGEEHAPPPGEFGEGPHVSYRFATSPIQGTPASINAASRTEMSDAQATSIDCFGMSCMTTDTVIEDATTWENERDAVIDFEQPYGVRRGGVISPAAAMDMVALEHGVVSNHDGWLSGGTFEFREGVGFAEPFAETIIEVNLGQDEVVDAALYDTHLMDHMTEALWRRVIAVSMGPDQDPMLMTAEAAESRTQPDTSSPDTASPSEEPPAEGLTSAPPREPGTSIDAIVPADALNMPAYRPDGAHMPPVAAAELVDCGAIEQSAPGGIIAFPNDQGRNWTDAGMGPVTVGFVGCSNTFEANIQFEAYHGDDEEPTIEGFTMGGAYGDWGMFEFEERFWTAGDWTVVIFEHDAASGARLEYDSVTFSVVR